VPGASQLVPKLRKRDVSARDRHQLNRYVHDISRGGASNSVQLAVIRSCAVLAGSMSSRDESRTTTAPVSPPSL
jgi:hypothetical protein